MKKSIMAVALSVALIAPVQFAYAVDDVEPAPQPTVEPTPTPEPEPTVEPTPTPEPTPEPTATSVPQPTTSPTSRPKPTWTMPPKYEYVYVPHPYSPYYYPPAYKTYIDIVTNPLTSVNNTNVNNNTINNNISNLGGETTANKEELNEQLLALLINLLVEKYDLTPQQAESLIMGRSLSVTKPTSSYQSSEVKKKKKKKKKKRR
jgi:hypothetical protein